MKKTTGLALLAIVGVCAVLFTKSETFLSFSDERPSNSSVKGLRAAFPGDSKAILDESDQLFLYSINSMSMGAKKNSFHGYLIVGRTEIKDKKVKADLVSQFYAGMAANLEPADCFFPHHALRAVRGGKTLDLLICFSCNGVKTYYENEEGSTSVNRDSESSYNQVLKKAGIRTNVNDGFD